MTPRLSSTLPLLILLAACGLADIRPDNLRDQTALTDDQTQRGRALLQEMEQAHGGRDAWMAQPNADVTLTDDWPSFLTRTAGMPWPQTPSRLQMTLAPGADTARITFLDGDAKGEAWGVQHWATYHVTPQGEVTFAPIEDAWFYVPTYAYFFDAPMRLSEAQYIADGGTRELNGTTYDTVYLTWGSVTPRDDIDQYVAWIDHDTHRLAFLEFTVRDLYGFFTSAAVYDGWHEVNGLQVPSTITIVEGLDAPDSIVHRMTIHDVRFNADLPPTFLLPDPTKRTQKDAHGALP